MSNKILVIGATGNVGSELVRELQHIAADFRVGVADIAKAQRQFGPEVEAVSFNFLQPDTYPSAFEGIERVFWVRPPALSNVQRDIAPAIRAAAAVNVNHMVFLSIQGVDQNRIVPHYKIEQAILQTGVDYTFLRAGFFMQNLSTTHCAEIREQHKIMIPVGLAQTSFIDVRDIAAVAALVLTTDAHRNRIYTLTGEQALTYYEVAQILSQELGQPIRYTNPSMLGFWGQQLRQGKPLAFSVVMTALYTITRFGNAKTVSPDVTTLLDRHPIHFDQFAHDFREVWLN
jgi:uncharacterized protein YbjT (DUF2867 family)